MKFFNVMILFLFLACGCVTNPAVAEENDPVAAARTLLKEEKPKQAFQLLRAAISRQENTLDEPRFALALADSARLYAPEIPPLNGGDRMRVELLQGAGELYRRVLADENAEDLQKSLADLGFTQLQLAMLKEAEASRERGFGESSIRLARAMSKLWPDNKIGPMFLFEIGQAAGQPELSLEGLRGAVATGAKEPGIYTLSAMLEQDEEVGDGDEAALQHLDAGLVALPGNLILLDSKTRLLLGLGRLEEVRVSLSLLEEGADKLQDKERRSLFVGIAGQIHDVLGETEEALKCYREALSDRPNNLRVRFFLGSFYFARAAEAMRDAGELPFEKGEEREALESKSDEFLKLARVELEYAHKNGEPDLEVMRALRQIYLRLRELKAATDIGREIEKME